MAIGDKNREGNTLILGGWKADLYLTPEGNFRIEGHWGGTEEDALELYNKVNGTSLTTLPPISKNAALPHPSTLLPVLKGRTLGAFESESNPGTSHYVIESPEGVITCTCFGFRAPDNCWHYRAVLEIGPKNITQTLVIKQSDLRKEVTNALPSL